MVITFGHWLLVMEKLVSVSVAASPKNLKALTSPNIHFLIYTRGQKVALREIEKNPASGKRTGDCI